MLPGRLRELHQVPGQGESESEIDIILIPGLGTPPVETWPFCSTSSLQSFLPTDANRARLLAFDYTIPLVENFSWESFLLQGEYLLRALSAAQHNGDSNEGRHRPMLCVCHSLGGTILKQALCIANEQLYRYEPLVNSMSGIIFLGTPHLGSNQAETLDRICMILKLASKKPPKPLAGRVAEENAIYPNLSKRFEGLYFRTPILSVYEKVETRISKGPFSRNTHVLVEKALCTTHAPLEQHLGLNLDHLHLCHFQNAVEESRLQLSIFIASSLENAEKVISARLEAMEFKYATTSTYSPTLSELQVNGQYGFYIQIFTKRPLMIVGEENTDERRNSSAVTHDGSSKVDFEVVESLTPSEPRNKPRLPCIMLDSCDGNRTFLGQQDILSLIGQALLPAKKKMISSESDGLRQFALCGLGGLGKTEIALEFAMQHRGDYDAIFWVRADAVAKLNECYNDISIKLGLQDPSEKQNHVVGRETLKGWLSNPKKGATITDDAFNPSSTSSAEADWLIIFDNADDPYLLTDYWPQGSGSVLITSRDPIAKSLFCTQSSGLDLNPLSDEDGAYLLKSLTEMNNEEPDDVARQISHTLGGLPLAIVQMASVIRRQQLDLTEFLALYQDCTEHPDFHGKRFDSGIRTYPHNISTVWAFERLNSEARAFLELMSFLDPDCIQEDILAEAPTEMSVEHFPNNKKLYREARTELLQSSLVKRNAQSKELSMHRLVQDAVRAKLDRGHVQAYFRFAVHLLWTAWPSAMPKPSRQMFSMQQKASNKRLLVSRWPLCAALYPHVLRLKQLWELIDDNSTDTRLQFAALLNDAAWYQSERGQTRGFDGFFKLAQDICDGCDDPRKDSLLIDIHFCLGAIAADTNDHTASREHKEKSLALQKRISEELGTADERLAICYCELSISRIQDSRYDEGVAALLRGREILVSMGPYVPKSREANLGLAYMLQGKLSECETLLVESLEIREKALGKNDKESFRTGRLLYALGNLRALQGRLDESYECHCKAWEQFRSTIGDQNHRTADVGHKIAEHLIRMGRFNEAITIINDALKVWSYDADVYKPELARTTFLKKELLDKLGRTQEAAVAMKVACRFRKDLVPQDTRDPSVLKSQDFDELVTFWSR